MAYRLDHWVQLLDIYLNICLDYCLSVSVCLPPVCLCACLSVLPDCFPVHLSFYLYLSVCLSLLFYLSFCLLSITVGTCLSICFWPSLYLSVTGRICLSVCLQRPISCHIRPKSRPSRGILSLNTAIQISSFPAVWVIFLPWLRLLNCLSSLTAASLITGMWHRGGMM